MRLEYENFDLQIEEGQGLEYPIQVVSSPSGEGRAMMHLAFQDVSWDERLVALRAAIRSPSDWLAGRAANREQEVAQFGQILFDMLFVGEVRSCFEVSKDRAVQRGRGLRLRLRIRPPEVAAIPWEFLYDSGRGEFVCLSQHTPIVRYIELREPPDSLEIVPPLRILGVTSAPSDLRSLDTDHEKGRLEEAVKRLRDRNLVDLVWLEGSTWRDLQRVMRQGPWHIFHFIGHGGFDASKNEGVIGFCDEAGRKDLLSARELGLLLADHRFLRLVFLNSCSGAQASTLDVFSSSAATLVRRGIPAVLANQFEISDRAAIEFARVFYEALVDGVPVDAAVAEGRASILLTDADSCEWGTPVLHMRAPQGDIFTVTSEVADNGISDQTEPTQKERSQMPSIEIIQVATTAAALLAPYLAKAGEAAASKAGEAIWEKTKTLYQAIRAKLAADKDDYAQLTLKRLEEQPTNEDRQQALSASLAEKMKADASFAQELAQLVQAISNDDAAPNFLTQVYDQAQVGKIINVGKADNLTIN